MTNRAYNHGSVAPVRERGLKFWIVEMAQISYIVAPVRERGLKCCMIRTSIPTATRRSREGAWIEMRAKKRLCESPLSRSREGAWIEIVKPFKFRSGMNGRSREGAWIEIQYVPFPVTRCMVAPVRERGLKYNWIFVSQ